jgi:glycosyltransferase involved in cell wall biosynthesis
MNRINPPLVSICIPTRNRANLLDQLLSNLTNQQQSNSYDFDFELIISDNASTDDTHNVICSYLEKLNIKYLRQNENLGAERNIINAYQNASGDYTLYLADDDLLDLNALSKLVIYLMENTEFGIAYAPWLVFKTSQKEKYLFYFHPQNIVIKQKDFQQALLSILQYDILPEICIFKTDLFKNNYIFDHSPISFGFFNQLARFINLTDVLFWNQPFYSQRVHETQKGTKNQSNHLHLQSGHLQAMQEWDCYRGGLEYLLSKIADDSAEGMRSDFLRLIDDFIAVRICIAIKLRISFEYGDPLDNYYLASRAIGLGRIGNIPVPFEEISIRAAIHFLATKICIPEISTTVYLFGQYNPFELSIFRDQKFLDFIQIEAVDITNTIQKLHENDSSIILCSDSVTRSQIGDLYSPQIYDFEKILGLFS